MSKSEAGYEVFSCKLFLNLGFKRCLVINTQTAALMYDSLPIARNSCRRQMIRSWSPPEGISDLVHAHSQKLRHQIFMRSITKLVTRSFVLWLAEKQEGKNMCEHSCK